MSFIVPEEIEAYAAAHTTPPDELLAELAEETKATLRAPQMLTGPIEGRLLELLVHGIQARRVLELGTYSGYSSLSMAAGLPEGGRIDTCEVDETHAEVARRYIARSPYADRITVHLGPALGHDRAARRGVRLRLHRRGQGELRQLLRSRAAEAGRRRPDRRRQHPLERARARRRRRLGGHPRDQGVQRACAKRSARDLRSC